MFSYDRVPAGSYMFKVNNRNTRTRCEICSKLAIKIPERRRCINLNGGKMRMIQIIKKFHCIVIHLNQ